MSEPNEPTHPTEPVAPAADAAVAAPRRPRHVRLIVGVALVVLVLLAGAAYAAYRLIGGGPQPAQALPASTIEFISVDLDPSAGQQIDALRTLRKVPDLSNQLNLGSTDDIRRYVFGEVIGGTSCSAADYDVDIKPWIGDRAALGAVDLAGHAVPVAVIQMSDAGKARAGVQRLLDCAHPGDVGFAVGKDYLILSDTTAHAAAIVRDATARPLADDATYKKWNGEIGDKGVVNFYVAKSAAKYGLSAYDSSGLAGDTAPLKTFLNTFKGLAGTVRFSGSGVELAVAAGGVDQVAGTAKVGAEVGRLPSDTAAVLGLGVPPDFGQTMLDQISTIAGGGTSMASSIEAATGLKLPGDLQTLLGRAVMVSVGGNPPAALTSIDNPSDVPAAVTVAGDSAKINAVLGRLETRLGANLAQLGLTQEQGAGRVTLATAEGYAKDVIKGGNLGGSSLFGQVIPDAGQASGLFFVQLGDAWRQKIIELVSHDVSPAQASRVQQDLAPLKALGASIWRDGDIARASIKLALN